MLGTNTSQSNRSTDMQGMSERNIYSLSEVLHFLVDLWQCKLLVKFINHFIFEQIYFYIVNYA